MAKKATTYKRSKKKASTGAGRRTKQNKPILVSFKPAHDALADLRSILARFRGARRDAAEPIIVAIDDFNNATDCQITMDREF